MAVKMRGERGKVDIKRDWGVLRYTLFFFFFFFGILSHTIFVNRPSSRWPFACCLTVLVCIIAWLTPVASLTLSSSLSRTIPTFGVFAEIRWCRICNRFDQPSKCTCLSSAKTKTLQKCWKKTGKTANVLGFVDVAVLSW